MNKNIITVLLIVVNLIFCKSQPDTLNKYNTHGKKQGYWVCYLDSKFEVTDSTNAFYAGFDLYDNGQNLTRIGKRRGLNRKKMIDSISSSQQKFGKIKLLNGEILFYNSKNLLIAEEIFSLGHPFKYKYYFESRPECIGKICELVDFTILYENLRGTAYGEFRRCSGEVEYKYWFRKGENKWKWHRIKE